MTDADSVPLGEYERLLQFLYLCPVGVVKFAVDGSVGLINPIATQLLMPVAIKGYIGNLFEILDAVAPELRTQIDASKVGTVCDQYRVELGAGGRVRTVAMTIVRVDREAFVASLLDISVAVANERKLSELARTDELTGALNRRALYEALHHELQRGIRYGGAASVVMLDIDHFKRINDTYGHEAGDVALRAVAKLMTATIRTVDAFGRLGGEEFAVLLPATDLCGAQIVAERLRANVQAMQVEHAGAAIPITASFGCAEIRAGISSVDQWLAAADGALYRAKRSGRNRVVLDDPLLQDPART